MHMPNDVGHSETFNALLSQTPQAYQIPLPQKNNVLNHPIVPPPTPKSSSNRNLHPPEILPPNHLHRRNSTPPFPSPPPSKEKKTNPPPHHPGRRRPNLRLAPLHPRRQRLLQRRPNALHARIARRACRMDVSGRGSVRGPVTGGGTRAGGECAREVGEHVCCV